MSSRLRSQFHFGVTWSTCSATRVRVRGGCSSFSARAKSSQSSGLEAKEPKMNATCIRTMLLGIAVASALVALAGCSAPTATPPAFSKEQAIARAAQDAKQSAPEVGIRHARLDSFAAELMTLTEADRRRGMTRGPAAYRPGQTPQTPVWWVVVRGYFQYEGMGAAGRATPLCEAGERDFIYDAQTGESVGAPIPNTRCTPVGVPGATATP